MTKRHLQVTGAVVGVALAAYVLYDVALGVTRGGALHWLPVVEGFLIAAAVLAVWNIAGTREAAALGLGVAVIVILGGAAGFGPALGFAQEPMGWATVLTLLVRFAAPAAAAAPEHRPELAER